MSRCLEVSFRSTREDKTEYIEGVETFKYLRRLLDQSDDDCIEVH